jgi:hypothetical protein
MDAMNWIGRMKWILMVAGALSIPACSMAVAQTVSLPEGSYRIVSMPAGAAGAGAGQAAQQQVKDDLFAGTEVFEKGASDVNEITMDPDTLDLVGGKDGKRAHNMILNVVRTYSYDKPGMYNIADVDAFRNKLNSGDWHCSVHTRDLKTGASTDVCNKRRSDGLAETAIITVEPRELTFIHTIRRKGDGESELGGLPMMYSLPGLTSLAMLDPQAFVDMQMAKARLYSLDDGALQMQLGSAMKALNSAEMQQKMNDAMKQLDSPEMQKRMNDAMKRLGEQTKHLQFQVVPDTAAPQPDQPKEPE